MEKFNGKGPYFCKNCGGDEGIHRSLDRACPIEGVDQTGRVNPSYFTMCFEPQEREADIEKGNVQCAKTLFDEYFMAVLSGSLMAMERGTAEMLFNKENDDEIKKLPETIVTVSLHITELAFQKRNEYLKGNK